MIRLAKTAVHLSSKREKKGLQIRHSDFRGGTIKRGPLPISKTVHPLQLPHAPGKTERRTGDLAGREKDGFAKHGGRGRKKRQESAVLSESERKRS